MSESHVAYASTAWKAATIAPLAAEMGDKQYYFVRLQTKDEFDTHGEGLCEVAARAKITGELHEHGLIVSSIELVSKSKAP